MKQTCFLTSDADDGCAGGADGSGETGWMIADFASVAAVETEADALSMVFSILQKRHTKLQWRDYLNIIYRNDIFVL